MDIVDRLIERARQRRRAVVLPEGDDPRIIEAARRLHDDGIARPILIGEPATLEHAAACANVSLDPIDIVSPSTSGALDGYASLYIEGRPKASERVAKRLLAKPLFYAAMAVKAGDADALVAGATQPTARVIEAGLMSVGLAEGIATPSSFFIMVPRGSDPLVFADCAVTIDPDADALADIAIASAASAERLLGVTARVAMLSFSTHGSAKHERVEKVRRAVEIVRSRAPELAIDGELQADAAIVPRVRAQDQEPERCREANVLVFPDLDAGNIGYKREHEMRAIEQGFARRDLSRGRRHRGRRCPFSTHGRGRPELAIAATPITEGPPRPICAMPPSPLAGTPRLQEASIDGTVVPSLRPSRARCRACFRGSTPQEHVLG